MTDVLYTPFDLSEAKPVGRRRFWKQVLPVTSIDYKGVKVDFDQKFHLDLATSFKDRAYDQVPIVFANDANQHNMDPRNFGGDVVDMEYRGPGKDQGTWALIEADRSAARAIKRNPKLGVSARIIQGVQKADGRAFPRAVEHICLTMNPRVTGMQPWQEAVDLSEDAEDTVVDLTAATYEEGTTMAKKATKRSTARVVRDGKTVDIDLSALSDDQFQDLLDLAVDEDEDDIEDEIDDEDLDEVDEDDEVDVPKSRKKKHKSKTRITVEKDSEDDNDDNDDDDDDDEDDDVDLTDAGRVIKRDEVSQFRQMQIDLAEQRWTTEREALIDDGVPPFLVDLATPVMNQPGTLTIDLADSGETIDATATIRKMLQGARGLVDLTDERGHGYDLTAEQDSDDEAGAFLAAWDKQYG